LWGLTFNEMAGDSHIEAALESLSEEHAAAFNAAHHDDPSVFYQSWAGVSSIGGIPSPKDGPACEPKFLHHTLRADVMKARFAVLDPVIAHGTKLLPNDGLVTVASAHHGVFRGCVPADHLDEVGNINGKVDDEGTNKHTGFNHIRFYRNIAYNLSAHHEPKNPN
jgi:triacylglycerol lipase